MENEQDNPQFQQNLSEEEILRRERKAKQAVVKEMWLGNFPERDSIHPAASTAAARMRVKLFNALSDDWIHEHTLKQDGKSYKLYVLAYCDNKKKKDFMAPVADTKLVAVADRAEKDQWFPKGNEIDFRVFEPITLEGRVLSGGPFIYSTKAEAQLALAELILEGAAITLSKGREDGTTLDQAVQEKVAMWSDRVRERSVRYEPVQDEMI